MSGVPAKHPKKKRRFDASQEPQPGPSSARPMKRRVRIRPARSPSRSPSSSSSSSEEESLSLSLRETLMEHFGSSRCIKYIRTVEALKRLHEPAMPSLSSSSSTEDEENAASVSRSKGSSFVPRKERERVCGKCGASSYADVASGNIPIPNSDGNNPNNKRRKTNVRCGCPDWTEYFHVSQIQDALLKEKLKTLRGDNKKSRRTISSVTKPKACRNPGWDRKDQDLKPKACRNPGWDIKDQDLLEAITDNEQFFKRYQDRYGLVENSMEEDCGVDYFNNLPTHIIELILCTVPILDFLNCRRVCRRWMDIIDDPRYMKWKKNYYKYKKDHYHKEGYQMIMRALTIPLKHESVDGCIPTIVNFMGKEFNRVHSTDMYDCLLQNPHGELADHVLNERFPKWSGKDSRVWCQLAVAVLMCETVWDILKLYRTLIAVKSNCLRTDVHDALYCFALFLFHFRCMENINCGLHYRIYYALYVIENNIPLCQRGKVQRIRGKQIIENYGDSDDSTLTYEQIRILNHDFEWKQKIKIIALAGSGKTTTLVHLARLYPEIKFLNIVFNKSVNREAKKKFPSNVVCKTAHAIAFSAVGKEFQHKLTATIRPYDLIRHIRCNVDNLQIYLYGRLVWATITNYMQSWDEDMSLQHVPLLDTDDRPISRTNRDRILMDASTIWQKMADCTSDVQVTHDVYLKLYQLKKPKLDQFQCIMVDEAQDCNPAILDIVISQRIPVLLVGDPYQQIYGFRGAKNALQLIKATHTYSLTKSFRFGPEISYMASCVLEVSLNMIENVLVGNTTDSNLRGESSGQFAVIARSNIVLFNEAVRMVALKRLKPYEPDTIRPFFAGGLASYGFDQILDIYMLKFVPKGERKNMDKFINRFKTLHDLYTYAKFSNDKDLKSKIELVNQHGHELPHYMDLLKQRCSASMQNATVVFSTAHKSKGLEFDTVSLTDDFVISPITGEQSQEEANILYVAITRAKKCLLLPEKVTKLLHAAHEKFEYPVSSKALLKNCVELKCVQCDSVFVPHTVLALVRRRILMASGREVSEGPLCMKCRSDPTMRPDLHLNGLIMYLDPVSDNSHRVMNSLVGPLPTDPPIVHDRFNDFGNADRVFVINLNIL